MAASTQPITRRSKPKTTAPITVHPDLNEQLLKVARTRSVATGRDVKKGEVVAELLELGLGRAAAARQAEQRGAITIIDAIMVAQADSPGDDLRELLDNLDDLVVDRGKTWTRSIQVDADMHQRLNLETVVWQRELGRNVPKQELAARLLLYSMIELARQPQPASASPPAQRHSVELVGETYNEIVEIVSALRQQTGQVVTVRGVVDRLIRRGLEQVRGNYQSLLDSD